MATDGERGQSVERWESVRVVMRVVCEECEECEMRQTVSDKMECLDRWPVLGSSY